MRKVVIMVAIVALAAATAFAYPNGRFAGQGGPCGGPGSYGGAGFGGAGAQGFEAPCGGPGFGRGFGPGAGRGFGPGFKGNADVNPLDEAGAKAKVQEYLDANFKGFEIVASEKYERPRGSMYTFEVKDNNANAFTFVVNPFGYVRGPIIVQNTK
ncbi:MAG: hypothetical protein C0602_04675 [Denitrovibrio sp.]|nr:MAG: hypothetical protein C0602_04675 [Denitrovibrio sp.]